MMTVRSVYKYVRGDVGVTAALRDLTFDVPSAGITCVLGPASSEKSMLARLVALRERPDAGVISVDGISTAHLGQARLQSVRRNIAVLDARELLAERTVAGNIASPMEHAFFDLPYTKAEVAKLLDLTDLTTVAGRYPGELDHGERQRVALAQALAMAPRLVVADAPGESVVEGDLITVLDRARAELGITALVLARDAELARDVDTVAILRDGHIRESGDLLALIQRPGSDVARALLPEIAGARIVAGTFDRVAEAVLVGFAAIGALLPEAESRFTVDIQVVGGGITRFGDTPVARFLLGLTGSAVDASLDWLDGFCSVVRDRGP
jgi:D-methionine transport system ATP-binding protein